MIFLTTDPIRTKVVQFSVCLFFYFPDWDTIFWGNGWTWVDMKHM